MIQIRMGLIVGLCAAGVWAYWNYVLDVDWGYFLDFDFRRFETYAGPWNYLWDDRGLLIGPVESVALGVAAALMLFTAVLQGSGKAGAKAVSGGHEAETSHGSAKWAAERDVKAAGLFSPEGVRVGGWRRGDSGRARVLRHDGPEHVLVMAPTRSGKGVSLVIPTLLEWRHSALVLDIKGENWDRTAGWREKKLKQRVLRFDPGSGEEWARWNPLAEVRAGTEREINDVQAVATLIMDPQGKGLKDFWQKAGRDWLAAAILHTIYVFRVGKKGTPGLADVDRFLTGVEEDGRNAAIEKAKAFEHGSAEAGRFVRGAAQVMLDMEERVLSDVVATVLAELGIYRGPVVARNTSESDFTVTDLTSKAEPVSLYLVVSPDDIDTLTPLTRLFFSLLLKRLKEVGEKGSGAGRLLLMMDEFASMGNLEAFEKAVAHIAGYGLKACLIVQDAAQVKKAYGQFQSIMSNCDVKVVFGTNSSESAELASKMSGPETIMLDERSVQRDVKDISAGHVTARTSAVGRPLIDASEVMRLGKLKPAEPGLTKRLLARAPKLRRLGETRWEPGEMLIFAGGSKPIRGRQVLYFQDPELAARSEIAPPGPGRGVKLEKAEKKGLRQTKEKGVVLEKKPPRAEKKAAWVALEYRAALAAAEREEG